MVTILSGGANGSSSWNRQTPLKQSGSLRRLHFVFERLRATREPAAVPVVGDVEQRAARVAAGAHLADVVRRRAVGHHAALKGEVGLGFHRGCHRSSPSAQSRSGTAIDAIAAARSARVAAAAANCGRLRRRQSAGNIKAVSPNNLVPVYCALRTAATRSGGALAETGCWTGSQIPDLK